jgi:hypothetical protein
MKNDVADRYISPGGRDAHYVPAADVVTLASFILWHDRGHMQGGVTANDAALAMARLLDIPLAKLRGVIRHDID